MTAPLHQTSRHVLVIDDDPLVLKASEQYLKSLPITAHLAANCSEGKRILQTNHEIALVICDQLLPDGEGVEFLRDMLSQYPSAIRVLMTGAQDRQIALDAINKGEIYRFMAKPIYREDMTNVVRQALDKFNLQAENARLQSLLALQNEELKIANTKLEEKISEEKELSAGLRLESTHWREACQNMVDLVLEILQRIDLNLFKHSQRVARLSTAIAREMGKDKDFIERMELAALLHDIGLLGASVHLQSNQRRINQVHAVHERQLLEEHPAVSADLVKFLPLPDVIEAIEMHHEYLDGSGYPRQSAGEHIPPMAAILSVADSFDETPGPHEFALSKIENASGRLYEPDVVRSLSRLLTQHRFEFSAERPVLIHELKSGMKLATSIYNTSGMLLMKQGQVLNESLVQKLQQHDTANSITQTIFVTA